MWVCCLLLVEIYMLEGMDDMYGFDVLVVGWCECGVK